MLLPWSARRREFVRFSILILPTTYELHRPCEVDHASPISSMDRCKGDQASLAVVVGRDAKLNLHSLAAGRRDRHAAKERILCYFLRFLEIQSGRMAIIVRIAAIS